MPLAIIHFHLALGAKNPPKPFSQDTMAKRDEKKRKEK
jgi:hypothetical protein